MQNDVNFLFSTKSIKQQIITGLNNSQKNQICFIRILENNEKLNFNIYNNIFYIYKENTASK